MPSFEHVTLETERLLLRPLRTSDAASLFAIFSDPRVMRYWSTPPWTAMEQAVDLIARDRIAMAAGEHLRFGIERKEDAEFLGFCTFFDFKADSRRAEIGYGLAHAAWGHGYMHEALVPLLRYGFADLDLNRVEADIDPRNEASRRSLERLGFKKEGFLPERWIVAGVVTDSDLYGLLSSDWKKREASGGAAAPAPNADGIKRTIDFIIEMDKLKQVVRKTKPVGLERYENSAEHSWQVCLLAVLLAPHARLPVDTGRVLELLLVHDIPEIDAGDQIVYQGPSDARSAAERAAARRIFGLLPTDRAEWCLARWEEYEARASREAIFAYAIDRLMPVLQNTRNNGQSWRENQIPIDRVLAINAAIGEALPAVWEQVRPLIEEIAAANGGGA